MMFDGTGALQYGGSFNCPEIHKGYSVKCKSRPYFYAGPGIDRTERVYENVGEVIRQWMEEDPANNTVQTLVFVANEFARQRGVHGRLSAASVYQYLNGRFKAVYKTKRVTPVELTFMLKNPAIAQALSNEKLKVDKDGLITVPEVDDSGKKIISHYDWYGCQPKDINAQLIEAVMSVRHSEATGYDPNTRFRAVAISPRGPRI